MPLVTIKLFGELAQKFTSEFTANINSVRDAVDALCVNFPGLRPYLLNAHNEGVVFKVLIGETWEVAKDEELFLPIPQQRDICITPVIAGSGRIGSVVLGVALLGLGVAGVGFLGLSAFQVGLLGGVLLLQGLFGGQTEAPDPEDDSAKSFIFNGATNTVAAGNRIPVLYGKMRVGSQVISASIEAYQIAADED